MAPVVEPLSQTDMEGLATYFSKKQWPALEQTEKLTPEVSAKAHAVLNQFNCRDCHQDQYQGDYVRPALSGQSAEYLVKTLTDFQSGERKTYPMAALVRGLDEDQIKSVSAYLASLPPVAPPVSER
jgi:cytochrome c553